MYQAGGMSLNGPENNPAAPPGYVNGGTAPPYPISGVPGLTKEQPTGPLAKDIKGPGREGNTEELMEELAKLAQSSGGGGLPGGPPHSSAGSGLPGVPTHSSVGGGLPGGTTQSSVNSVPGHRADQQPIPNSEGGVTNAPMPPHPPPPTQNSTSPAQSPDQTPGPDADQPVVSEHEAEKEVSNLLNVALANKAGRAVHTSPFKDMRPYQLPPSGGVPPAGGIPPSGGIPPNRGMPQNGGIPPSGGMPPSAAPPGGPIPHGGNFGHSPPTGGSFPSSQPGGPTSIQQSPTPSYSSPLQVPVPGNPPQPHTPSSQVLPSSSQTTHQTSTTSVQSQQSLAPNTSQASQGNPDSVHSMESNSPDPGSVSPRELGDDSQLYIAEDDNRSSPESPQSNKVDCIKSEPVTPGEFPGSSSTPNFNVSPHQGSQANSWGQPVPPSGPVDAPWMENAVSTTQEDGTERFYCHLCSYVGTSQYLFKAHMNSHFEHNCPHCDYTSRTEGRLKKHIKDFHSETAQQGGNRTIRTTPGRPKLFRCKQCEFVATNKEDFWTHARVHIKAEKVLQCPKCPFVTEYKHHLEYHLRNHFGSKPFKCQKCNYSCVNKSMLNSHMKSHTNVYQYRCADCTYATKYCHSLKLHLQKYNHKPATVLNIDGSLPMDGSGDFELVSKRGPPRGPRGPRTEKSPPPGAMKHLMPRLGMNAAAAALNGAMMPGPFWPLMGQMPNGMHGPPPLIPVSGMGPLSINLPQNKFGGSPQAGSVNPPGAVPGLPGMKCNWCDFVTESPEKLNMHVFKIHGAENQDIFNIFGIRPETLIEEQQKFANAMHGGADHVRNLLTSPTARKEGGHGLMVPGPMGPRREGWGGMEAQSKSPGSQGAAHEDFHYNRGSRPDRSPRDIPIKVEPGNRSGERRDGPLDLSRPCPAYYDEDSGGYEGEEAGEMEQPGTPKRPSTDSQSSQPRKRSRKGKAYKLDTLCRRLQERNSLSPAPEGSGDEYPAEYSSEAGMEEDSMYPQSEESGQGDGEYEDQQQLDLQSDLKELHASIQALNGVTQEAAEPRKDHSQRFVYSGGAGNPSSHNGEAPEEPQAYQGTTKKDEGGADLPKNRYECNYCQIIFQDCVMYTMHMGYHGYKDPFKCNMCGAQASNKVEFFLHIARAAHE